jgi:hypothetical protein
MRRLTASGLAALTFAGALVAGGVANAEPRHYHHHHNDSGAAVAAGIAGLAVGAAIASGDHPGYYARPGYDYGYYGYGPPAYGYDYGPRRCRTYRTWDPYYGAWVDRTRCW